MRCIICLILLVGCFPRQDSLENVSEEVISKDRGVQIDIEPGLKK